jgi:hypothetical protein
MKDRYKFKSFHIDKECKSMFSADALTYLKDNKPWLYNKINDSLIGKIETDWILIIDNPDDNEKDMGCRTLLICSDHLWYKHFENMFFNCGDLIRGAVMNLQSDHEAIKECATAIIKGDGAVPDNSLKFPYSKDSWEEK